MTIGPKRTYGVSRGLRVARGRSPSCAQVTSRAGAGAEPGRLVHGEACRVMSSVATSQGQPWLTHSDGHVRTPATPWPNKRIVIPAARSTTTTGRPPFGPPPVLALPPLSGKVGNLGGSISRPVVPGRNHGETPDSAWRDEWVLLLVGVRRRCGEETAQFPRHPLLRARACGRASSTKPAFWFQDDGEEVIYKMNLVLNL
jgi:hypothetical protein